MKVGDLLIDESEIVETFVRSSGPGGQNVNKVASAVELRFDARGSPSLPNDVAIRLMKLAGSRLTQDGVIVIFAQRYASQPRNRDDARARLADLITKAQQREKPRRPTKPTRASQTRRLDEKGRRGVIKAMRGKAGADSNPGFSAILPASAFVLLSDAGRLQAARRGMALMRFECEIVVDAANELGEGVLWSPAHGEYQWTDIFGRRFWAHEPTSGRTRSMPLPDRLGCFAPLGGTSIFAGFAGGLELFDLGSGARRLLAAIETELPTTRVNDGRLDRRGRLVFGTMDEDPAGARPLGQIWSFRGRGARVLASGVRIANSIGFSPDGRRMYFADTPEKRMADSTTTTSTTAFCPANGCWCRSTGRDFPTDRPSTPMVACGTPNGAGDGWSAMRPTAASTASCLCRRRRSPAARSAGPVSTGST